jgi:ArsR family transcriptional regulator, arsenate/arsenite/antimonite-responsive transcriptional repressor
MTAPTPNQQTVILIAKVLTNPTRLRMLEYLERSKMAMCSSFTRMIGLSQPQASRHLKKMLEAGIVTKERIGKTWIYQLDQEKWRVVESLLAIG